MTTVGVAIPSIPTRTAMLARALASVARQDRIPDQISVAVDLTMAGAAATRNRAWRALDTEWVAFLDDDDELLPRHLHVLLDAAEREDADFVFPWFEVEGGTDPFPHHFGKQWDPDAPRQTTVTGLWRRAALDSVGGFLDPGVAGTDTEGNRAGEEFRAVCRLSDAGGQIVHVPDRTWIWRHHGGNTSGLPDRW